MSRMRGDSMDSGRVRGDSASEEAGITPVKIISSVSNPLSAIPSMKHNSDAGTDTSEDMVDLRKVSPLVCTVLWISLGTAMILFNKAILAPASEGGLNFQFPFFLTMIHQIFATIATQCLHRFSPLLKSVKENRLTREAFWKKVTPLSLFFSLGLVLGNSAYKYLSVSYIQMIKSTLPIPTLLVAYLLGRERNITTMQVFLVLIICGGAIIASFGELHFSTTGFIIQCFALFADVFRMLFLDLLTIEVKLDNLSTLYYVAPVSGVLISIGFYFFEYGNFDFYKFDVTHTSNGFTQVIQEDYPSSLGFILLANAFLAFALNLSIVLFVSNVGIFQMALAGIFKDVSVVVLSAVTFGSFSKVTMTQAVGYSCSLIGLILYKEYKKGDSSLLGESLHSWYDETFMLLDSGDYNVCNISVKILRVWLCVESIGHTCHCCWGRLCCLCSQSADDDNILSRNRRSSSNSGTAGIVMTNYVNVNIDSDDELDNDLDDNDYKNSRGENENDNEA